jgi:hypothetical protein
MFINPSLLFDNFIIYSNPNNDIKIMKKYIIDFLILGRIALPNFIERIN